MKELYYLSSTGVKINLINEPYRMLSDTDLFNYDWEVVSVGQNFPQVKGFKNQMYSKKIKVRVKGNTEHELLAALEHLTEIVDADVRNQTIGRIHYGDYYRDCFVVGNEKPKFLKKTHTTITLTLLSPNGDWRQEKPQIYSGLSGGVNVNNSCFPSVSSQTDWEYSPLTTGETNVRWESLNSTREDIALNQDADSPEYSPSHTPAMAVDGDYSTYFEIPANATDKSLVVTFDKVYHAKNFILQHPQGITGDVRLYDYSTGERGYYFGKFNGTDPMTIDIDPYDVSAVEVVFESTNAVSVVEFVVYEDVDVDAQPTLLIDLGEVLNIDTIGSLIATTTDTTYLESSEDGEAWDTLDSGSGSHTFYWHNSNGKDMRYIRLSSISKITIADSTFEILQHAEETYEVNVARLSSDTVEGNATSQIASGKKVINIGSRDTQGNYPSGRIVMDFQETFTLVRISDVYSIGDARRINCIEQGGDLTDVHIRYGTSLDNLTELEFSSGGSSPNKYIYWSGSVRARYVVIETDGDIEVACGDLEIIAEDSEIPLLSILNDNYVGSDALIKIYGPTLSPNMNIGESSYGIDGYTLEADQYLEINTQNKTLRVYDGDDFTNVFNYRIGSTFDKIPSGSNNLTWQGNLTVEITLKKNRSEPKWT